jgi:hypothetical protein
LAIKNFTIPTGLDVVGAITATTTIAANGITLTGNTGTVTGVTGTAPIVSSGGTAPAISISAATTSAAGSMSSADKTKLDGIAASANNYSLPTATSTALGGIELFSDTAQTVAATAVSATASRTYGLQLNAASQGVINVPWTDTVYSLPTATSTVLGGVELFSDTQQTVAANAVSATASRTYGIQVNAAGQAVVNVPWVDTDTNTTYSAATSTVAGLIELFSDTQQSVAAEAVSATASRTYGIQVNAAGQAVVNVPWVDTNTDVNWNGGTTGLVAATGRTSLGATTLGSNLFQLANVAAISFPRINADNTVSSLDAAAFRTAIGAGTSSTSGTVTSVTGTAPIISSGGTTPAISISAASSTTAGTMSIADKNKLDGIAASANNYSLPTATSTALGGIELFSDTVQTVAAESVSTTASRTYGIQLNSAGQAVVNVPWTGSAGGAGTVTSVAASVPAFLSVSGSPITTTGTLAITLSGTALPVANGGTGSTSPSLVQGTNISITGSWPNQTINASNSAGVSESLAIAYAVALG